MSLTHHCLSTRPACRVRWTGFCSRSAPWQHLAAAYALMRCTGRTWTAACGTGATPAAAWCAKLLLSVPSGAQNPCRPLRAYAQVHWARAGLQYQCMQTWQATVYTAEWPRTSCFTSHSCPPPAHCDAGTSESQANHGLHSLEHKERKLAELSAVLTSVKVAETSAVCRR